MAGGVISNLMYAIGFKFNSSGVDEADSKVKILTKSVVGMGIAGGAALVGLGAAAISASSDFENAMSDVQMATGQTSEQMLETKEIARNLYNQSFGENWEDLGGSIAAVAKTTQLTGDALENATREAMLYAGLVDGDVAESIAGVKVAMDNFGVSSTEAFNLLTQGEQQGTNAQGDLLDSINEYSQAFASMGFDMEDTLAYLDNGMQAGARSTDLLGDAMNEFSILSIEAGGTAATSFQMLGLDSDKMMQTFAKGGPDAKQAFKDIVSMVSDVQDPVAQNTIGVGLFGTMFEELGVKAFSALDDVNTGFDKGKDSVSNLNNGFTTVGEGMEYFRRHIETGILQPIGDKLLPYLSLFATWMTTHQPQIEKVGDVIGSILGGAIDGVTNSFLWLHDQIDPLEDTFNSITDAIKDHKTEIEAASVVLAVVFGPALVKAGAEAVTAGAKISGSFVASIIKTGVEAGKTALVMTGKLVASVVSFAAEGWRTATAIGASTAAWIAQKAVMVTSTVLTWAATAAQWALNAAFWANPLTWIVVVVVALIAGIVLLIMNWDWVSEKAMEIWDIIKTAWSGMTDAISGALQKAWDKVQEIWGKVTGFFKGMNLFQIGADIINGLVNGISSKITAVTDKVKEIGNMITGKVKSVLGIHSPSRVMMEMGMYTGEGLALGIDDTQDRVGNASSGLATEIIQGQQTKALPDEDYTPESAPAGPARNSTHEITVKLDMSGVAAGVSSVSGADEKRIRQMMHEEFLKALRIMGLEAAPNG